MISNSSSSMQAKALLRIAIDLHPLFVYYKPLFMDDGVKLIFQTGILAPENLFVRNKKINE